MKKVFYFLIIVFCIYVVFVLYTAYAYKFYNEKSGFIKPEDKWSWYGDVATTIECSNEKCMLVLFSLKDGVNLKEFPIDENQTNVGKYDKLEDTPYQQGLSK